MVTCISPAKLSEKFIFYRLKTYFLTNKQQSLTINKESE